MCRRFAFLLLALFAATPADAGSVAQPGSTAGLPVGSTRSEGVYFENTSSYGERSATRTGIGVNLTQVVWATPFRAYDTQLLFFFMQPTIYRTNTGNDSFYPNSTYAAARLAHDFGGGLGLSYQAGFRAAQQSTFAFRQNSLDQRAALTYKTDDWMLTGNLLNGLFFAAPGTALHPNWLNLDLTALRKFGKAEIGAVAFASTDISSPTPTYRREGQIAVGAFASYDFGTFKFQTYVTRDVAVRGYTGYDTRGWTRLIVPLYQAAPSTPEPIRMRY